MNERDKAIIDDLTRFRCMTRDDIATLHFHVKNRVTQANMVLKRLRRDGYIDCATDRRMYIYFPVPSIKKDSAKIPHYLSIVDFYRQCLQIEKPKVFEVEPRIGEKGTVEPDIFLIWQRTPFYVEIQRSVYSQKVMDAKMKRYADYFYSDDWKQESWQPPDKKIFPRVWIVGETRYNVVTPFKVIQSKNVAGLLQKAE